MLRDGNVSIPENPDVRRLTDNKRLAPPRLSAAPENLPRPCGKLLTFSWFRRCRRGEGYGASGRQPGNAGNVMRNAFRGG